MTITPTSAATTATAQKSAATTAKDKSVIGSDFNTFLTMLTAQIKNQDPLNPIDSSDYAVQLATFSGVEQQVQTNDLLRDMGAGSGLSGLADLAGWVGMEARVQDATVSFDGAPVDLYFDKPVGAKTSQLVVATAAGIEVQRLDITGAGVPVSWDGTALNGDPLASGSYTVQIESTNAAGTITQTPVETYAAVTEVRAGSEGAEVVLADGRVLAADDVTALRAP